MFQKLKQKLKKYLESKLDDLFLNKIYNKVIINNSTQQVTLKLYYKELAKKGYKFNFEEVGFNVFSSTNEDGILLYIFSIIDFKSRKCVDLGCGSIKGSNTANLVINHGFSALLIDSDKKQIKDLENFYKALPFNIISMPIFCCEKITMENINDLILNNGFNGEIDFLSIDLDGIDFWVLKAIETIKPRVILVEYQDALGPDRSLTIPYTPDFNFYDYEINKHDYNYMGASLSAFINLLKPKGYKLIGCNTGGWNAFFILNDLDNGFFREIHPSECFIYERNNYSIKERYPLIKDLPWVEV
ncbi:MAG: hypothetical protein QXR30_04025 [Candidatus Woesearchaeota archaeon]